MLHVWFSIFSIIKIDWKFEDTKRIINQKISIEHNTIIQWQKVNQEISIEHTIQWQKVNQGISSHNTMAKS